MKAVLAMRRFWRRFLDGPSWLRESHGLGLIFRHYRSPSLKFLFWCMAWYERLFSRPMRMLFIVLIVFTFFATLTISSPAIPILMFLVSLLIVDFLIGWIVRPRLEVRRIVPGRVKCGVPFPITYHVRNLRRIPAAEILFDPNIELPELRREEGFRYRSVAGRGVMTFTVDMDALKRGIFELPQGVAESAYPFNLFKHSVLFGKKETVIVHPASRQLRDMFTREGGILPRQSSLSIPQPGESMDFYGCRAYRPGDSPRKIHWRATARYRVPIIKEYQKEQVSHAAILLDTYIPPSHTAWERLRALFSLSETVLKARTNEHFEAAVSLAASIGETLTSLSYQVELLAVGAHVFRFPIRKRPDGSCNPMLDVLSTAAHEVRDAYAGAGAPELASEAAECGTVFFVMMRWDRNTEVFLDELSGRDTRVVPIFVTDGTDWPNLPDDVHVISPDAILYGDGLSL